ncbi:putative Histone-lysine N-methyltransferase, H3 lysine-79 specific [Seiridium cardinale]|uniref:Histone-lysine N-methyltransferase, H3 lysine-79 specific n=1 Tax=Seiridium cardinale TaxID=138064 RepID=A0ABR2Y704_9PEZI
MPLLKAKSATQAVRVERVVVKKNIPPKPPTVATTPRSSLAPNGSRAASKYSSSSDRLSSPDPRILARTKSASPYPSSSDEKLRAERKRKVPLPRKDSTPMWGSDDSGDDDDQVEHALTGKRRKVITEWKDPNRRLRHKKAFGDDIREPKIIHGADLASVATGCPPAFFGAPEDEVAVDVQYPSRTRPERYELVFRKEKINAVEDIKRLVKHVAETYLTAEQARPFIDNQSSFYREMERASNNASHASKKTNETVDASNSKPKEFAAFKAALGDYNKQILALVQDGSVEKNLDATHDIPAELVDFILAQVYERTVSPTVETLNKYQPGGDNVYGELMAPFVRAILRKHGKLTSDKVFIDLGSGVGNVVLQAALEIGCSSYGCEMVENSCNFAEAQEKEFRSRCLLWGLRPGMVTLERGDFRTNKKVLEVLKKADCILVNNKAFTPALNDALVRMFMDLKPGCKVVSLVSFVMGNEKNGVNDIANSIFESEEHQYFEDWVSWSKAGGRYFVSTRRS